VETVVFIKAHELKATFRPTKKIYIDRYMGAQYEKLCVRHISTFGKGPTVTLSRRWPNDFLMVRTMTESMCGMIAYITRIPKMRSCTAPKDKKILYLMAYSFGGIS
jgi:hypothetical protein